MQPAAPPVVVIPPTDEAVPDGYQTPSNVVISALAVNTGDVITYGWHLASAGAGVTRSDFDAAIGDAATQTVISNPNCRWGTTDFVLTWTADRPRTIYMFLEGGGTPNPSSHGTLFGFHVEHQVVPPNYCQYGTELQTGASFVYYLTPGLIDVWLTAVEMPWLAPVFTALYFSTFNAQTLCQSGPPALPTIDLSTFDAAIGTIWQVLYAIAWPNVCQCKPGSPNPTPYPPPAATQPTGWPAPPVFSCADTDVCATLVAIQKQIASIQATLGETLGLETLVQRYSVPFAYVQGKRHDGMTEQGSFGVDRIVGILIQVTAFPPNNKQLVGVPPYIYDLGWVSILTGDGLIDEIRLTRLATTWLSKAASTATVVGYGLREGVTVDLVELEAEP